MSAPASSSSAAAATARVTPSSSLAEITAVLSRCLTRGLPLSPMPPSVASLPLDPSVPHAPVRTPGLTVAESRLAVRNALRYFPPSLHAELGPEFAAELEKEGHIYMRRFAPTEYEMAAYPISCYPGMLPQCRAIQLMLMNNLDRRVAQFPQELITYGGNGSVLSNWAQYHLLMKYLSAMNDQQSLCMSSGHPAGLFPSPSHAPRVVISNGMVIPNYSRPQDYQRMYAQGNTIYGQMTAGSWVYIGPQGIVHGTTITILNAGRKYLKAVSAAAAPDAKDEAAPAAVATSAAAAATAPVAAASAPPANILAGAVYVSSGLGGMSGAQGKAGRICGCVSVIAEIDPAALTKRLKQGWIDESCSSLSELMVRIRSARAAKLPLAIGYLGNIVDLWEALVAQPDQLADLGSDQTSLHNAFGGGYWPQGYTIEAAKALMESDPAAFKQAVQSSLRRHVAAINTLVQQRGLRFWDYGNAFLLESSRAGAEIMSVSDPSKFRYPSYIQEFVGDVFSLGFGPFRWICTSGDPADLRKTDQIAAAVLEDCARGAPEAVAQQLADNLLWIRRAEENQMVVGSQARILYADARARVAIALAFNDAIRSGHISAPIVLSRDHHDVSGTDSPFRETSNVYDGSSFTADMAMQNVIGDASRGATWVSIHNGGGVGWGEVVNGGFGLVLVGDADSAVRASSMLSFDVNNGVARRAWAGNANANLALKRSMADNPLLQVTEASFADDGLDTQRQQAELAALRASSRYQQHQSAFGRAAPSAAAAAPSAASAAASSSGSRGPGSSSSIGGFKTPAQRKLDALNAANRSWAARAGTANDDADDDDDAEARRIRAARDSAHDDAEDEAEDDDEGAGGKKRKTAHAAAATVHSAAASAASSSSQRSPAAAENDDDEDAPVVVSDASEAEQALLASMLPTGFGARPKKGPDLSAAHASKLRKDLGDSLSSGGAGSVKVKLEGQREQTQRPLPRKATTPAAPPSLLGGSYDSSDDSDDNGPAAAASSSAAAAAASSAAAAAMSTDDEADSSDDGSGGGGDGGPHPLLRTLPISHEASLSTNGHTKTVSALTLDKSGSRVLSGGYDYQAKLWDFGGMNESLAAFRTWEPQDGHQVRHLTYSASGDMFLAITGGAQPKLYNRDAAELATFVRGDMYIMDQKLTKGHSTPVTSGWFHPANRSQVVTSGIDGTVRLWDINDTSKNLCVVKPRGIMRGVSVTATAFNKDGKLFAAACNDGSIHVMKPGSRPVDFKDDKIISGAHNKGSEPSALLFSADGWSLFSRGGGGGGEDHTLKQWDLRMIRPGPGQAIATITDLPNVYPETDMCFSPDERVIVTGTGTREVGEKDGSVVFIDRATLKPFQRVAMGCKAIVRSVWHAGINQLLFGCNDGAIRLLYDPARSTKGVLQCIGRRAKAKPATDFESTGVMGSIMLPHALPSMRSDAGGSRKRGREKASAALAPEAPVKGKVGVGGRAAGSQSMAAFHLSKVVAMRTDPREKDPREALLAMDELAKADPMFFGIAYAATQPKTILAEVPEDERLVALTQDEINLTNKKEGAGKKL